MVLRTFAMDDYDAVIALWKKAGIRLSRSDTVEGIRKKLERDPQLFLVMVEAGAIIGAVMGSYDGRRGWVNHLAIDPLHQGKRLGSVLLAELERRFRELGCEKVNLLIEMDNAQVQGFYQQLGFRMDSLLFMEKWM